MTLRLLMLAMVYIAIAIPGDVIAQSKEDSGDLADIYAFIHKYSELEDGGKILEQAQLMVKDRTSISATGRRSATANSTWIKVQQEAYASREIRFPGVKYYREVRDLQIRKYGDMAVASFEWYTNTIIPGDLSEEKLEKFPAPPEPVYVTHVLIRVNGAWKIFHSHFSAIN